MKVSQQSWRANIVWFLISQGITLFGSQIVQMAIVWYVTRNTGSGSWVAAVSIASYLPQFIVSFAGGYFADRYSRKTLIILSDLMIAFVTLAFMVCVQQLNGGYDLMKELIFLSVVRSAAAGIQAPSVNAAIADMVPADDYMRYNGLNAAIQSLVQFVSPAAAVVALASGSLRSVFSIDVVSAVIGISILYCLRITDAGYIKNEETIRGNIFRGLRSLFSNKGIRNTIYLYGWFLWWSVPGGYLAGLYVARTYGDSYWYLTMVEVVGFGGMLLGGILLSRMKVCLNRMYTAMLGLIVFGFMSIAMSISKNYELYLICMLVYGIALTVIQTTITTMLQELSTPETRGRVFGLMSSIYASIYPIGMAVFGALSDMIPLVWLMIVSGIALSLIPALVYMRYNVKCPQYKDKIRSVENTKKESKNL